MGGAWSDLIGRRTTWSRNSRFVAGLQGDLKVIRRVVTDGSPALLAEGRCLPLYPTSGTLLRRVHGPRIYWTLA